MKRVAGALAALALIAAGDARTEAEHVVTAGETLASIARKTGVPVSAIAQANGFMEMARVRPGQTLIIPRQQSHTVKRGETSFSIAYKYGVPWDEIAIANSLESATKLAPGRKLIIPALIAPPRPVAQAPSSVPRFTAPVAGEVLLGWRRRGNSGHEGLDFAAAPGTRVTAAAPGTVIYAGNEPTRFGKLVVIDHGRGWHTAYGYLSRVTVRKGDTVTGGERVGLAGQTGEATRPEVHFEIRRGGKPVDPAPLMAPNATR